MGQKMSKSEAIIAAESLFNDCEKQQIGAIFERLCQSDKDSFTEKELRVFVENLMPVELVQNLHRFMCQTLPPDEKMPRPKSARGVTERVYADDFLVSLAQMLKGSADEKARLVCTLTTGQMGDSLIAAEAARLLEHMLQAYVLCLRENPEFQSWQLPEDINNSSTQFAKYLGHDLFFKGKSQSSLSTASMTETFEEEQIRQWLSQCPIFLHMMKTVFYTVFPVTYSEGEDLKLDSLVPYAEDANWAKFLTILDLPSIVMINSAIYGDLRLKWRFLFSTNLHGSSFSTLYHHISNQGPTLIIIRDTDGNIFGAFAAESWQPHGSFYGNDKCFLFTLAPAMNIYPCSGYNKNYQYYNHGQETIPNGLGFGGQLDYFGLWIDAEFGKGNSRAQPKCTTYSSPQLSARENFLIDYMEVWAVREKPKPQEDDEQDPGPGSILDKDPEAKAMLSLINRGPVSEGLREEDPEAAMPAHEGGAHGGGGDLVSQLS